MINENSTGNLKCVMVIDNRLPAGLIANTAAILGISLGRNMPQVVGADVHDRDGGLHPGIIEFPVPILKGSPEEIQALRKNLASRNTPDFSFSISRPGAGLPDIR